jgi:hypothetical protein
MLPVTCLVAFLCLAVWSKPFPSSSFVSFTGHNSLSAFTDIVKDRVAMFLGVLVLHEPSPLGGAARWGFRTGPIIDNPKTGCLLTPSRNNLVIELTESGFKVMDLLLPPTLDTCLSELEHLFSPSAESSPMLYLLTFEQAFCSGLWWGQYMRKSLMQKHLVARIG